MEAPEDENWKFGHKTPQPDNILLSAVHSFIHKNSLSSMGIKKHKGISNPDLERAFREKHEDDDETNGVAELFKDLGEIEFVKPDLRKAKRNVGRDIELFGMIT